MADKWEYVIVRDRNRKDPPVEFKHPYDPPPCPCPTCGHIEKATGSVFCGTTTTTERGRVRAIEIRRNGKRMSRSRVYAPSWGDSFESDLTLRFENPMLSY